VPAYTTLVDDGTNFATAALNGGAAVNISLADDDENAGIVASGKVVGSAITFYLGAGQQGTTATGGTMAAGDTIVISYQVKVD